MNSASAQMRPLLSIIVPSLNQGRYLGATLDSILGQDYRPIEVWVIDGGSTDHSIEILQEYARRHPELRWISEPDRGVADAVNKGLALANGEYAGIQSSDDRYLAGALAEAMMLLEEDPDLDLLAGETIVEHGDGRTPDIAYQRAPLRLNSFLARTAVIHQGSTFFRLARVRELGGWSGDYFCADSELWLRMLLRCRARKADRVWSAWRQHDQQRDRESERMWQDWGRMIDACDALGHQPLGTRLAARAGRRLMALSYNPGGRSGFVRRQTWLALLTYPPAIAGIWSLHFLAPGLETIAGTVRRLRNRLQRLFTGRSDTQPSQVREPHRQHFRTRRSGYLDLPMTGRWHSLQICRLLTQLESDGYRTVVEQLADDGAFGAEHVACADWPAVSRDAVESALEIVFLDRHLDVIRTTPGAVVELGAGYGRLAHALQAAAAGTPLHLCTDLRPGAGRLSELFLAYGQTTPEVRWFSPEALPDALAGARPQLAVLRHAVCATDRARIHHWLADLAACQVPWLFLTTDEKGRLLSCEADGRRLAFNDLLRYHGYLLTHDAPPTGTATAQRHALYRLTP